MIYMTNINIEHQLINNPLEYRSILTIPKNIRFGLELELESVNFDRVYSLVRKQFGTEWIIKTDESLVKSKNAEIATPVFTNNKKTWMILKKLEELMIRLKPTFENASLQVNFDGSLLPTEEERIAFLKLYAYYEDIIYRYAKGESSKYRDSIDTYASPIILYLKGELLSKDNSQILETFSNNKKLGIVFKTEGRDIIEFRSPNGSCNGTLWQNYITLFYYLIEAIRSQNYNMKEIDEYLDSYTNINMLEDYEELREDKALKLSKHLFTHQQDRTNFLHHYLHR